MMEMDLVGRVDVLNGFEAPFGITNKRRNKKKAQLERRRVAPLVTGSNPADTKKKTHQLTNHLAKPHSCANGNAKAISLPPRPIMVQ